MLGQGAVEVGKGQEEVYRSEGSKSCREGNGDSPIHLPGHSITISSSSAALILEM